jgi:hypothetical protein
VNRIDHQWSQNGKDRIAEIAPGALALCGAKVVRVAANPYVIGLELREEIVVQQASGPFPLGDTVARILINRLMMEPCDSNHEKFVEIPRRKSLRT